MKVVVKVNGDCITDRMLEASVGRYIVQLEEEENDFEPTDRNLKYVRTEALNYLIERILLIQLARKSGVTVSEEELERTINGMRGNFDDEEQWKNNLLALHVSEPELSGEVRDDLLLEKFLDGLYEANLKYTEDDIKNYFSENERFMKEPDIFNFYEAYLSGPGQLEQAVAVIESGKDKDEVKSRLETLGIPFEEYAQVPAFKVPQEVLNILSDLEPGKIGTMALPDGGMIIYKLKSRTVGNKLSYDSVKTRLAEYLIQNGKKELYSKLVRDEMERASIEYVDTSVLEAR